MDSYRDLINSMLDIYLSSVSNRMNQVMKVLTVFATIFIPLTFLVGVYGMISITCRNCTGNGPIPCCGCCFFWCRRDCSPCSNARAGYEDRALLLSGHDRCRVYPPPFAATG